MTRDSALDAVLSREQCSCARIVRMAREQMLDVPVRYPCLKCRAKHELAHLRGVSKWAADAQRACGVPTSRLARVAGWLLQVEGAPEHELRMLDLLIGRLARGRGTYGPWEATDGRDNPAEALEEVVDALHYCAAELLRLTGGGEEG